MKKISKIGIYIVLFLTLLIPSASMITDIYYIIASFAIAVVFILTVLSLPIPLYLNIPIALIICLIYRKNIILTKNIFFNIITLAIKKPLAIRKDYSIIRDRLTDVFSNQFKLHKEFDKFPNKPSIFVCNYCTDRIENMASLLLPGNHAFIMRDGLKRIQIHHLVKWPIYTKAKDNYETTKQEILHNIKSGRHVFAYVSKPPKLRPDYISSVRTGLFSIAKQLNIPITLVCIDYIDTYFGAITKQNFRIRIGDTFMVDDVSSNVFKVKKFFKETMNEFIRRKYENIYL